MQYTRETSIGCMKAKQILEFVGRADEWDDLNDYFLCTNADGDEHLHRWGDDEPIAINRSNTSWHSPGLPN